MQTTGQGAHVHDGRQLELFIMPIAEQGSVDQMALDSGGPSIGADEIPLSIAAQTRQLPDVGVEAVVQLVDQDDDGHEAEDQERETGQFILHQVVEQEHGRLATLFDFCLCRFGVGGYRYETHQGRGWSHGGGEKKKRKKRKDEERVQLARERARCSFQQSVEGRG